jgi:hypothetical protein
LSLHPRIIVIVRLKNDILPSFWARHGHKSSISRRRKPNIKDEMRPIRRCNEYIITKQQHIHLTLYFTDVLYTPSPRADCFELLQKHLMFYSVIAQSSAILCIDSSFTFAAVRLICQYTYYAVLEPLPRHLDTSEHTTINLKGVNELQSDTSFVRQVWAIEHETRRSVAAKNT